MTDYRYLVEDGRVRLYDGPDAADAMAAWSKAIAGNGEYVIIEALRAPLGGHITVDGKGYTTYGTCPNEAANHPAHAWGDGNGEVT